MTNSFPKSSHHSGLRFMIRNPHPKKERHGDCGVRAISLALNLDYNKVWNAATKMKQMNAPVYEYNYGGGYVEYKQSKATATRGLSKTDLVDTLGYLGYEAEYIREYIQHSSRKNVEFIEIENWNSSQIASFKQIPKHVFDEPLYYNACDNWSTQVRSVQHNTYYTCKPENDEYYDTSEWGVYSGISFIKDSKEYYDILQATDINRNDLLLLQQLDQIHSEPLDNWNDVGNIESYHSVRQDASFSVLDKTHQEIYSVNGRIIKAMNRGYSVGFFMRVVISVDKFKAIVQ